LGEKLHLSGIGDIAIKKHRDLDGTIKTLTIKKSPSGKWYAIFISEVEVKPPKRKEQREVGIDLGVEHFAHLSDDTIIENPRHLKKAEDRLKKRHKALSNKQKGSRNRRKARLRLGHSFEKLTDARRDLLHKLSRKLVDSYSLLALENLNVADMARGFLAKHVLDCGWAEFLSMLTYTRGNGVPGAPCPEDKWEAEGAGCEVVLVDAAHTTQECSGCGQIHKKTLSERWHECPCGASMHRDLNAAMNILARATGGTLGSQACLRGDLCMQASSMKQEAHAIDRSNGQCVP